MPKRRGTEADKRAQEKLNQYKVGTGSEDMVRDYTIVGGMIVRKHSKVKLTKAERKQRTRDRLMDAGKIDG